MTIRILLTGGHGATVGIAVVEALRKLVEPSKIDISWIGTKRAKEGSEATTLEYKIYSNIGVEIYPIEAGKLQTKFTRYTILSMLKIPLGFVQALVALSKVRPQVVLSLGGFASFPVVFWAWFFRIPVILHEQTVVAGRASMTSAFFSRKIALARAQSQKFFPKDKTVVTGNPVMSSILSVSPISIPHSPSTILVMGGSRGSQFINDEIIKIMPELVNKFKIIHITGESDYEKYKNLSNKNYEVLSFVDPREIYKYYEKADLIISRSGANTVSEILATKRPAILVPLPRTFMGEQVKNAEYAKDFGLAKVMLETEVNSESLKSAIDTMFNNWQNIVSRVNQKDNPDKNAAEKVANLLLNYVQV